MAPSKTPPATSLAALAALLPEASACGPPQVLVEAARDLRAKEVEAIAEFERAGWECIRKLGTDTLMALRSAAKAIAAGAVADDGQEASSAQWLVGQNSVAKMFEQFDTNGDGLLSQNQFKEMLVALGLTEHFSDEEIASLVGAADTNKDGSVDLHEFTEWLYAGAGVEPTKSQAAESGAEERSASKQAAAERQRVEDNLRRQLLQTRSALEAAEQQFAEAKRAHESAMRRAEERSEEDLETAHQFWRAIAEASATDKLGKAVDLEEATMLGHGKYGYVLKSKRRTDGVVEVLKLLSLRWAHVAAAEWGQARAVEGHPNIVEYADVLLHSDENKAIQKILVAAREAGRLQTRVKRDNFPKTYVCLMQEFMNAGTVQDWMERQVLPPGGLLVVMKKVAAALTFMHSRGLTHNDIKPENILLNQADETDAHSAVTVKLADFGLAKKSRDTSDDFWQYGMTVLCMVTGEKFGERKYQPGSHAEYVEAVEACVPQEKTGVCGALRQLPDILRQVFEQDLTMGEICQLEPLYGWDFFDGEEEETDELEELPSRGIHMGRRISEEQIFSIHKLSARRSTTVVYDPKEEQG